MEVTSGLIGVINLIAGWTFFLITLSIFKGFIVNGVSIAITEFLLKCNCDETREKVARWLGNSEEILAHIEELRAKIDKKA